MSVKRDIAHELHRPARKNFNRRTVNVYGRNDLWQADLVEMIPYAKQNKGFKYILCVIDCFTKFAWTLPLKSKTGSEVSHELSKILTNRSPRLIQLDKGKEFYNKTFDALMKKYKIKKYSTYSTTKACIVERFNRTLKEKMFREFTARGTHNWISMLPMLMKNYNSSIHRTIGMTPIEADGNPSLVVLKKRKTVNKKVKFNVGDKVRISTKKGVFTKGYLPNWSMEVFTVIKINKTSPPTYILEDYTGKPIAGCFYSEEISKTSHPDKYLIKKIIRRRGSRVYVNWLGFDSTHDSWVNVKDVETV